MGKSIELDEFFWKYDSSMSFIFWYCSLNTFKLSLNDLTNFNFFSILSFLLFFLSLGVSIIGGVARGVSDNNGTDGGVGRAAGRGVGRGVGRDDGFFNCVDLYFISLYLWLIIGIFLRASPTKFS